MVIHDRVIPDFPYSVIPVPGMTLGLRLSRNVDSVKIAVVIPDPRNASEPMLVTDDGIVIDVKPVAFRKALAPMLLKPVIVRLRV